MTVEQLIELLEREYAQALVFVTVCPCVVGAAPGYRPPSYEGEIVSVCPGRTGNQVHIEAVGHDC